MTNPITIMLMTTSVLMLSLMAVSTAIEIHKLINRNSTCNTSDRYNIAHEFLTKPQSLNIDDKNAPTLTDMDLSSVVLKTDTPDAEHKITATGNSLPKQYIFDVVSSMLIDNPQITRLAIYESLTKSYTSGSLASKIACMYLVHFRYFVKDHKGKEITNTVSAGMFSFLPWWITWSSK